MWATSLATRDSLRTPYSLSLRPGQTNIVPFARRRLTQQQKEAGLMPPVLTVPKDLLPEDATLEVTVSRSPDGSNPLPITFETIDDWSELASNPTLMAQLADSSVTNPSAVVDALVLHGLAVNETYYVQLQARDSTAQSRYSAATQITTASGGVKRYYYGTDHLGSVRVTVSDEGEVVQAEDYDPFGLLLEGRSLSTPESAKERYTGHELDEETDLYYAGARYLDPVIGRWLAVDPLADKFPEYSPYNYVLGNPLRLVDPDGKAPCCLPRVITPQQVRRTIYAAAALVQGFFSAGASDLGTGDTVNGSSFTIDQESGEAAANAFGEAAPAIELGMAAGGLLGSKNPRKLQNLADATGNAAKKADNVLDTGEAASNLRYDSRIRKRGVEDPKAHNFPYSFDNVITGQGATVDLANGYKGYLLRGTQNGKEGVFNIIVSRDGVVTHRDWVSKKKWKQRSRSFEYNTNYDDIPGSE